MAAVLITGAGKRVGAIVARRFAASGWRVLVHANQSLTEARAIAAAIGGGATVLAGDLGDAAAIEPLMREALRLAPDLEAVVNSASLFEYDSPSAPDRELWSRQMQVNAFAPAQLAALFAQGLADDRRGAVIHVLDQKLANFNPDFFSYTASKAALAAIARMQAMAFAPRIRVTGVAPGLTLPSGDQTEADFLKAATVNLLQRRTFPEEIAEAIYFAATGPLATGQTVFVDSGHRLIPSPRDTMFTNRAHS